MEGLAFKRYRSTRISLFCAMDVTSNYDRMINDVCEAALIKDPVRKFQPKKVINRVVNYEG